MIIVSYTRMVSCMCEKGAEPDAISRQNTHIAEYMRKRKWKLSKKYSDRKNNPDADEAFKKMKQDGMERKYDCVVIDSINRCGKNVTFAIDLFQMVFLPAGIHFAVVEDDFYSGDYERSEAEMYLQRKGDEYRHARRTQRQYCSIAARKYPKYGYRYKQEGMELELEEDQEAADIVREIFGLAAAGKTSREIADILNDRGMEEPTDYLKIVQGKPLGEEKKPWTMRRISHIIRNNLYIGQWKRTLYGKKVVLPCPVLVDETIFQEANKKLSKGKRNNKGKIRNRNAFAQCIWDKDMGFALNMYTHHRQKIRIFRFVYSKPMKVVYEKTFLEYEIVENEVKAQLQMERK